MQLYTPQGYVDIGAILSQGLPFNFIVGGRGSGKTYGALKYCVDNRVINALMRRTQTQCDMINRLEFSPYKAISRDMKVDIEHKSLSKNNAGIFLDGTLLSYTCALSTISSMRGFDMSDVKLLVYDEFIPEAHERVMRGECEAFMNAYETIARNRELQGAPPLQVLCLANAWTLANPLFMGLELVTTLERQILNNQTTYTNRQKGIFIAFLLDSPISEAKSSTTLYKIANESFKATALSNMFADYDADRSIGSKPLKEYTPFARLGELTLYEHKNTGDYYVTTHNSGSPQTFKKTRHDISLLCRMHPSIHAQIFLNTISYETYYCKALFNEYLRLK